MKRKKSKTKPGPNFFGYKRGWNPKKKEFADPLRDYDISLESRKALRMIDEEIKAVGPDLTKGKGVKAHRIATEKLQDLGLDPIDQLAAQLTEIEAFILKETLQPDPRVAYLEKLQTLKLRILETLVPYRYGKAPIITVEDADQRDPIRIILSTKDD